jgi:hypothetical protein
MSYSMSRLLPRDLHDVFDENDPAGRRAAVDEIFSTTVSRWDTPLARFYPVQGARRSE